MKFYDNKSELDEIRLYYHNKQILKQSWLFEKYPDLLAPFNNSSLNLLVHIYVNLNIIGSLISIYHYNHEDRAFFIDILNFIIYGELNPISKFFGWLGL